MYFAYRVDIAASFIVVFISVYGVIRRLALPNAPKMLFTLAPIPSSIALACVSASVLLP